MLAQYKRRHKINFTLFMINMLKRVSQNKNSLNFNIVNINNICNKHMNDL
ncbi:hypothetical protein CBF_1464 [Clostridium botulinum F str. 230613]|nr:hypothetical protein CBF_1464 [Clostridium botulinum F str. 230613]